MNICGEGVYIARTHINGKPGFCIRESYLKNGIYQSRDLMDLDRDPCDLIRYPTGRSFYVDGMVEDTLRKSGADVDFDELEELFWPFLKPEVRRRYGGARSRRKVEQAVPDVSGIHLFDRRRMSYLRTGSMNQRHIAKAPSGLFHELAGKSRDELEQAFITRENALRAREIKSYVYVIFDLQRHFKTLYSREMPQAMDQDKVADHLLDDICHLNRDAGFWTGMPMSRFLHDYLVRYLIMFFDSDYVRPTFFEDLEFERLHRRRHLRQTRRPVDEVYAEASAVFSVPIDALKKMSRRDVQRLYRNKAREVHPDQGGSHERFIELSRLYEELLSKQS